MANWKDILDELRLEGSNFDIIRKKHVKKLSEYTKRNNSSPVYAFDGYFYQQLALDILMPMGRSQRP